MALRKTSWSVLLKLSVMRWVGHVQLVGRSEIHSFGLAGKYKNKICKA